jgi:hypothetical protein
MKTISSLLLSLLLVACGGASQPATPSTPAPQAAAAPAPTDDDPSCPVAVPGTSVSVEDTDTGAALVFVTTGDAAELRRRVGSMASMHNDQHGAMGPLPTGNEDAKHDMHGMHGDHASHGGHAGHDTSSGEHAGHAGGMISVHSQATTEEIVGGARLAFIAAPTDVAKLQDELRMHAQHFAAGTCHPARADAPTGRLAGPPPALRPGATAPTDPAPPSPPAHDHGSHR